jgi:trimethylamine--corrinoid protein Co-methyltransferase
LLLDNQLDWCQPRYGDALVTPIDEDAVQAIHAASMTILENLGVLFLNDAALSIFESQGCQVEWDSKRVRMDRAWVMEQVAKAPRILPYRRETRIGR